MGKKNKKSSTATGDLSQTKKHKKSSTATDIQTAHVPFRKSLKIGSKRGLIPCSKSNINRKKQKSEETKEIERAITGLTETVKKLQEILLTRADLPEEEETLKKANASCCCDCEEGRRHNEDTTLYVKGFEYLRDREEIKKELTTIFRCCGEITRVHVPWECRTGVPLGFAFIDLKNGEGNEKALGLNGCYLAGGRLEVMMAKERDEFYGYTNFRGCDLCQEAIDRLYENATDDDVWYL